MAKISAFGETEVARWRFAGEQTVPGRWSRSPQTLVLTAKDGKPKRLLRKYDESTGGFALVGKVPAPTIAEARTIVENAYPEFEGV